MISLFHRATLAALAISIAASRIEAQTRPIQIIADLSDAGRKLSLRALGVLQHLAQGGLPDIQISIPLQMIGFHLLMRVMSHRIASHRFWRNRPARIDTISDLLSGGTHSGFVLTCACSIAAIPGVHEQQTSIHSRFAKAKPSSSRALNQGSR